MKIRAAVSYDLALLTEAESLVVELADALTATPSDVSDEFYARLRETFSEEQLLELGSQIAFENYRARLNRLFNIGSDHLYETEVEQHV